MRQGRGCPTFSVRQPSASHNALRARVRPLCMHAWFYSVVSLATFSSCSLDSRPILPPDAGTSSMSNGTTTSAQTTASNVDAGTSSAAGNSDPNAASAQTGIGGISTPAQPAVAIPPPVDMDAGPARPSQPSTAQPTQPQGPATRPNTAVSKSCSRDTLQKRAAAYLQALSTGDLKPLNLHPQVRYTENGQTQMLGLGLWLSRPKSEFSRHVLDELRCSASTVAVLNDGLSRTILGVRLRYVEEQLLEVEAQVVYRNLNYYDPDAVIPMGADPWIVPVPDNARMTREALVTLAERYFDSTSDPSMLPAHAPGCKRTQNGALLGREGSCAVPAGNDRFEQRRFPVIDEVTGVVVAIVYYRNFVGMCLFKAQDDTLQNMEVIGGATAQGTGW